jgi:hypothetical protein
LRSPGRSCRRCTHPGPSLIEFRVKWVDPQSVQELGVHEGVEVPTHLVNHDPIEEECASTAVVEPRSGFVSELDRNRPYPQLAPSGEGGLDRIVDALLLDPARPFALRPRVGRVRDPPRVEGGSRPWTRAETDGPRDEEGPGARGGGAGASRDEERHDLRPPLRRGTSWTLGTSAARPGRPVRGGLGGSRGGESNP